MSDTDVHRPAWVRCNDHRCDVVVSHHDRCHRSGGADCDLPPWPVDTHHFDAWCSYRPDARLRQRIYGYSSVGNHGRKLHRRAWFAAERTAQRAILRSLTRDARYGGAVDDEVIDNRQTHRHVVYGGRWWD